VYLPTRFMRDALKKHDESRQTLPSCVAVGRHSSQRHTRIYLGCHAQGEWTIPNDAFFCRIYTHTVRIKGEGVIQYVLDIHGSGGVRKSFVWRRSSVQRNEILEVQSTTHMHALTLASGKKHDRSTSTDQLPRSAKP
jgi:hypothetical protein